MEENEDEPEDVRNSTPVEIEIRAGEKDETAGNPQSEAKKPKHKSPSCDVKSRQKNKVEDQLVMSKAICCAGRNNKPFKPPKSMSVFIYSPLCTLPKLEIIPRQYLSKKEYIDMLATASRKCPPPCCGKSVVRRIRPVSARMIELAQPARRQLMATLQDRAESLPAEMIDNLVKTMEENSCLTPEQAEDYFREKNPRRCRKSARRSRKLKRQSKKQESCGSQLNKESVTNQYVMAERFVKSILQWRCSIPTEDFQDIANVILRRLSLTLEYDPLDNKDLRSQQMRFLADIIACWISGVLFEVSEDHRKEIEEEWRQRQLDAERIREEEEISVTMDFGDPLGGGRYSDEDSDESKESEPVGSSEDEESRDGRRSAGRDEEREKSRKWRRKGGRWEKEMSRKERKSSESVGPAMDEAAASSIRGSDDGGVESSGRSGERRMRREEKEKQRRRDEEKRRREKALEKERARKREARRKREEEEEEKERKRERRRKEKEERKIKDAEARRKRREAEKKRREEEKKREREAEEERKKKEEEEKRKKDEEEERKRREEEEQKKQEEEERRKKEEEEKKKQEEEAKMRVEEEERRKKEEEEKRKEEEEKKRKEEEERVKEAAAKKQKEEEKKKLEERKRKAEEEKKLKEAEKKKRKEEAERQRERVKRRKKAGEPETRGDRGGTYGPVLDTIYNVLDELPSERVETDPVVNRIQRAIYEKVLRRVESEDPASVDENFKDLVDVVASKTAAWLNEALMDAGLRLDERSVPTVRSVEIREWARWVDDVTEKANDWADWIHKLVEDAEEKSTEQVNRGEWYDWTSEAETDALLWRRYYLETTHQAYRNKMMMAGRPVAKSGNESQSESPVEVEITDTDL